MHNCNVEQNDFLKNVHAIVCQSNYISMFLRHPQTHHDQYLGSSKCLNEKQQCASFGIRISPTFGVMSKFTSCSICSLLTYRLRSLRASYESLLGILALNFQPRSIHDGSHEHMGIHSLITVMLVCHRKWLQS